MAKCTRSVLQGLSSMMTSSNGNIFRVTGHLSEEFTGPRWIPAQRPVTQSFDVFFDLCLKNRLSKQSWGWWFEMLSRSLWRHRNVTGKNASVQLMCTVYIILRCIGEHFGDVRMNDSVTMIMIKRLLFLLTHRGRVTHIFVSKLSHHWFR